MTTSALRLDLLTESGRKLIAEVRTPTGVITDAAVVRVSTPDRPTAHSIFRVFELRDMRELMDHMGFEDNDPLSVGHGNLARMIAWIDGLNERGEGEG